MFLVKCLKRFDEPFWIYYKIAMKILRILYYISSFLQVFDSNSKNMKFSEIGKIAEILMKMFCNCLQSLPLCLLSFYGFRLTYMVLFTKCKFFQEKILPAKGSKIFMFLNGFKTYTKIIYNRSTLMFAFCYFIYRYIWRSGVDITVINIIYLADKHIVNDAIEIKILSTLRLLSIENKT